MADLGPLADIARQRALEAGRNPYAPLAADAFAEQGLGGAPVPAPAPGMAPPYAAPAAPSGPGVDYASLMNGPGGVPAAQEAAPANPYDAVVRKISSGEPLTMSDMVVWEQMRQQGAAGAGGVSATARTTAVTKQADSAEQRDLRAERASLDQQSASNVETAATAAAKTGLENTQALQQRAVELRAQAAQQQKDQETQSLELQRRQADIDAAHADYVKSAQGLDPNRMMHGGRGVMASIALGLGAYGAALNGGRNAAFDIINAKMERDFEGQKLGLQAKREGLTMAQQAFQNYRQIYQDDVAAKAMTKATVAEAFAADMSARAERLKGTEEQVRYLTARDDLLRKGNDWRMQAAERLAGQVSTSTTTQLQGGGAAGGGGADLAKMASTLKAYNEATAAGGNAPTQQDRVQLNDVAKTAADYAAAIKRGNKVFALLQKTDGPLGGNGDRFTQFSADQKSLDSAERQLRLALINASSGKVFSDGERKEIRDMLNAGAWTNQGRIEKLKSVQDYMAEKIQGHIATLHPELAQTLRSRLAVGKIAPEVIDSMFGGQAVQTPTTAQAGQAIGLRP